MRQKTKQYPETPFSNDQCDLNTPDEESCIQYFYVQHPLSNFTHVKLKQCGMNVT